MPYKTRRKKWCSYDEFTRVDLFGSVLKMTSGLLVCCGAKNYGHSVEVYHTTLKKKKKKKKSKNLQIFRSSLPLSLFSLFFLFFSLFPLSPPPIPATPFLIFLMTNRGTKRGEKKERKTNKQKTELCIGPAHLFDPCCVFLIFSIVFHTTILVGYCFI